MKRFLIAAAAWMILLAIAGGAFADPAAPEAPQPARPAPRQIIEDRWPEVIDRVTDPGAEESFRFRLDAKLLDIWFPNIMNADEAILMYGGEVWMIDCGDAKMGSRGVELIRKLGITSIDRLINSHPHHDHLNGLYVTDQAAKVRELDICFSKISTEHMISAVSYAESNDIAIREYGDGDVLSMGDGAVTLKFWVNTDPSLDMNNQSAQTMVTFGERKILFTADMEQAGQAVLMERVGAEELKADLIKYPHHGKRDMYIPMFEAVAPRAAIITNRRIEDWNGVKFLRFQGIPVIYTNREGAYLHAATDGEHWIVEYVDRDTLQPLKK